jgi:hypothetical protein
MSRRIRDTMSRSRTVSASSSSVVKSMVTRDAGADFVLAEAYTGHVVVQQDHQAAQFVVQLLRCRHQLFLVLFTSSVTHAW